ncbi:MAG: hypothetical protein ACR2MT_07630 [Aurantibacter sp.]
MKTTAGTKLIVVKLVHTVIWVFFNLVLVYMFYVVITDQVDYWFWIGVGLIALECAVLLMNKWTCPLSPIARKYTDSSKDNFDIYIPNWLAKHNKLIYSILFLLLMLIYFYNLSN